MKRPLRTLLFVLAGVSVLGVLSLSGGTAHAQSGGGVGSGGTSGGNDPAGHWTYNGFGWRLYPTSGKIGPTDGFKSGSWAAAKSACTGHSDNIAVFVIADPGGSYMGYNYHTVYSTFSAGKHETPSPWIKIDTAKTAFYNLPASIRSGYTFGSNVAWFCYGYKTTNPPATLDGYKIDDSGGGAPYYGRTSAGTYSRATVSVTSAGSDSRNPFYFTNAAGGGSALSVGTGKTTARVIRVTNVPPDWQVVGYGICYGSGCNPMSNFRANSGTTPTLTFTSGRAYHMRWVFRQIPDPTCSSESFPDTMAVGRPYTFSVRVNVGAWPLAPTPAMYLRLTDPLGNTVINNPNQPYTVSGLRLTSSPITFTPTRPGTYTLKWGLSGFWAVDCPAGGGSNRGDAGEQPYLAVNGGDALAGDGGITGYNLGSGSYNGGGAQLAALSSGDIVGFVTGRGNSAGVATQNGASMGFANVPAPGAGTYGGNLNVLPAATSFLKGLTGPTFNGNLSSLTTSGVYVLNAASSGLYGNLDGVRHPGLDITVIAETGNIRIAGNITYTYSSLNNVPRLNVYTEDGDIIIDRSVTQIHGVLIAESNDEAKGFVYTCGVGGVGLGYAALNGNGTACSPKLTIFGSVTANQIILGRTSGSWVPGRPDTSAAETILYSPEVWLHRSDSSTNTTDTKGPFDSYVTLPPIL